MASTSETVVYDDLFSLVARTRKSRISDNIGNSQPTLDIFLNEGAVEVEDGGESIEERLMYAYQDVEWMSDRQQVSTDDKNGVTTAVYPWRFALAPVNISKTDELKAQKSKDAAKTFAESKIIQARQGLRTSINTAMLSAATGKAMLGFQDTIKTDPTTGTLGGVDQSLAANSWFRNQTNTASIGFQTQTVTNVFDGWVNVGASYEAASDINDEVTHIGMGSTLYNKAISTLESAGYTRFTNQSKPGLNGGGQKTDSGPMFRSARLYKDRAFAASSIYGYNIKTMKLKIMKGANFAKTPFVMTDATGVLGKVCFYLVGIQLVACNPRRNFVLSAVS